MAVRVVNRAVQSVKVAPLVNFPHLSSLVKCVLYYTITGIQKNGDRDAATRSSGRGRIGPTTPLQDRAYYPLEITSCMENVSHPLQPGASGSQEAETPPESDGIAAEEVSTREAQGQTVHVRRPR